MQKFVCKLTSHCNFMKFYFEAEPFVAGKGRGSVKLRIFQNTKLANPKHTFAVVYSTLKYKEHIEAVIRSSRIKKALKVRISDALLLLLVHDLLFSSRGRIQLGKHPIKNAFLEHRTRLLAEFTKLKLKYGAKLAEELPTRDSDDETPVRWFRINTIKTDKETFFKTHLFFSSLQPVSLIDQIEEPGVLYTDEYVPNLYGIHPKDGLMATDAYKNGEVIIQDRASCFPAHILNNDPNDVHTLVVDACAAPGNKTTHAASYLPKDGKSVVYAFERDARRVKILSSMCEKATGTKFKDMIHVTHADFTTTSGADFPSVTGLLVDPSCSGSGIFGRALEDDLQEQDKEEVDEGRLIKLAAFQFLIVKHALSFPAARKVVYSTCSIHPHENERVVVDLLRDPQVAAQGWTLGPREVVIPLWPRRGWEEEFSSICGSDEEKRRELAGGCVRAVAKEDGGIGFFAACFVRGETTENAMGMKGEAQKDVEEEQELDVDEEWTGFE